MSSANTMKEKGREGEGLIFKGGDPEYYYANISAGLETTDKTMPLDIGSE